MQSMAVVVSNSLEQPANPEAGASGVGNLIHQGRGDQEVQQVVDSQVLWVAHSIPSVITDGQAGSPLACPHFTLPSGVPAVQQKKNCTNEHQRLDSPNIYLTGRGHNTPYAQKLMILTQDRAGSKF